MTRQQLKNLRFRIEPTRYSSLELARCLPNTNATLFLGEGSSVYAVYCAKDAAKMARLGYERAR